MLPRLCTLAITFALLSASALAADEPAKSLLDPANKMTPTSADVSTTPSADPSAPGLNVKIQPCKEGYPGLAITPAAPWDLSAFGHLELRAVNTGDKPLALSLRVDNAGPWQDNPWNTESATIKPGATGTIKVIFGYSYGHKPGYALDPKAIKNLLVFTGKPKEAQSFRIEAIEARGPAGEKPPVDPNALRIEPREGALLGPAVTVDAAKQLILQGGASAVLDGAALHVTLPAGKKEAHLMFAPAAGRWDLRHATDVKVTLKNIGKTAASPRVLVASNGGATAWATLDQPLAPGASADLDASFTAKVPWEAVPNSGDKTNWNGVKDTGTTFLSDAVKGVTIAADPQGGEFEVQKITAEVTPATLPDWLGKRPPVEGDWVKTFDDEFTSTTLDASKWNVYGSNFWDKKSHFSKDNVILGDGAVRLRFEKKTGHQNDDPENKQVTDYATGFLDTYGKWTQRYGYFETRTKLPTAPGLWPAFWMMPDRGASAGPQWKRADTGHGAMEFDAMEHLTRWGPYRYNIAMHWDGYGKTHKQTGCTTIYVQPDKDGYITSGVLWLPGKLVYYCNGRQVASWDCDRISTVQADLMFTLPMGGWDNNALDDKTLPADFAIDYVRCWQRKDLASPLDGPKSVPANAPQAAK